MAVDGRGVPHAVHGHHAHRPRGWVPDGHRGRGEQLSSELRTGRRVGRGGRHPARQASALLWWRLYVVVVAAGLTAELTGAQQLYGLALVALVPLLIAALTTSARTRPLAPGGRRLLALTLAALLFSWLGDCTGPLFLPKVAFFLVAQCCYVAAFWPYRQQSVWRRPGLTLAYAALVAVVLALVLPWTGTLTVPVIGYAASLVLMATLATGVHREAGWGGAVFVLSDAILALSHFVGWFDLAHPLAWNLVTYAAAQALLVRGLLRRASPPAPLPRPLQA